MSKILVVEDDEKIRRSLIRHLTRESFEVQEAENGRVGFELLGKFPADLILLDAMMPVMNGYEMCKKLKSDSNLQDIFVLMISAKAKPEEKTYGLDIGADDYLTKPFDPIELVERIKKGLEIGRAWRVGTRDQDTGLYNRSFFNLQLAQEIAHKSREPSSLSIALIKIDSKCMVGDALESSTVQKVKKAVGDLLVSHSRFTDTCAMRNKQEFIVLLKSTPLEGAKQFAEKISKLVKCHDFPEQREVTVSIGIAELQSTDSEMIKCASLALQKAEQSGGNAIMTC